jgi:hypothetical protein
VNEFAKAHTKQAKYDWFINRGFSKEDAAALAEYLNLPGANPGGGRIKTSKTRTEDGHGLESNVRTIALEPSEGSPKDQVPADLLNFIDRFLYMWIVQRNVPGALDIFSLRELSEQLRSLGFKLSDGDSTGNISTQEWARAFLTLWLLEDHSRANDAHHGLDETRNEVLLKLLESTDTQVSKMMQFNSLDQAISWDPMNRYKIVLFAGENTFIGIRDTYAVVFHFTHVPRDAVLLVIRNDGDSWIISRMLAIVTG